MIGIVLTFISESRNDCCGFGDSFGLLKCERPKLNCCYGTSVYDQRIYNTLMCESEADLSDSYNSNKEVGPDLKRVQTFIILLILWGCDI